MLNNRKPFTGSLGLLYLILEINFREGYSSTDKTPETLLSAQKLTL
ncbi:hypothetical protein [Psychrobacter pygoscelis]|nr:hypothetical protein [Psychrobacter pygoscelis]